MNGKAASLLRVGVIVMLCALAQNVAPSPPASNTAAAASRDLWQIDEARYVRRWLLLGPISNSQADEIAKFGSATTLAEPRPGAEQKFSDDGTAAWRPLGNYGDVLDGFSAGNMKDGEAGFALAQVDRATAGDARLLLGGNVRGIWINGKWIAGGENSQAFIIDGREVTAPFNAGSNAVLLRVERVDRPVLLSLRVVDPGFASETTGNISPYITADTGGVLRVLPGARLADGEPVKYEVVAPGMVIAETTAARDQPAEFRTGDWADGPYEVRVTSRNRAGETQYFHLPWFKGDANADAQRLLADAAAAGADGHLKMLADMVRDRAGGDWRALHSPLMEYREMQMGHRGRTGADRAFGFVRLAWTDDIDGSTQFCRAYLPANYRGDAPTPALIFLHGYNPPNPPYVRGL